MSKVPEHDIHVVHNGHGRGTTYGISYEDEKLGTFQVWADDAQKCEERFRKAYRRAMKKYMAAVEAERSADQQTSPADPDAHFTMQSQDMGGGRRIKVELDQDNLPRDLDDLAKLYFDVIYEQDPDFSPDELAKDKDLVNFLVVSGNETKTMSYLASDDVENTCKSLAESTSAETAERIQAIVDKMSSLAKGIYSIREDIQKDMADKYAIMTDEEIVDLLKDTSDTKYQLMFAVALFMGIDISRIRQVTIHKGFVSTTTDMNEKDELKMYHYNMTGNLSRFIQDNCEDDLPLGIVKDENGEKVDHCIGLTIGDPDELEDILTSSCPGHTLRDLYATFWVRGLD